ncbi:Hpt domain-containing protein [Neomegalonema perideroedes]|uniref:Hpt domain-containing protein n=1 Tax=Neomegalonema perideroedes TaxID=217219 RepID=UPI003898FD34
MAQLRARALVEFRRLADELEAACAAGDALRGRDLAHQTVGAAGFLGMDELADTARVIEDAASDADPDWAEAATDLVEALRAAA